MKLPFIIFGFILILVSCDQQNQNYSRAWTPEDKKFLLTHLDSSHQLVIESINDISQDQWNWKSESNQWSVALIVEHLITHDELFFRELQVLTSLPQMS